MGQLMILHPFCDVKHNIIAILYGLAGLAVTEQRRFQAPLDA